MFWLGMPVLFFVSPSCFDACHRYCFACKRKVITFKLSEQAHNHTHTHTHTSIYSIHIYDIKLNTGEHIMNARHSKSFMPLTKRRKRYWLPYKKFFHS